MSSAPSKYDNIYVGFSFWLADKIHGDIISPEMWSLLLTIEKSSSLSDAARKMGISYRKAWDMVRRCEEALGFNLFIKSRGGRDGGITTLSADGEELVAAYHNLIKNIEPVFEQHIKLFKRTLKGKRI